MTKKPRTESFPLNFVDGWAEDWAFNVGDFFRMQLDIRLDQRMDTEANTEKKKLLGRSLKSSEKVIRLVWTQGEPPAYSFDRGHMFHERSRSTSGVYRSIVVLLARPDPGALTEVKGTDDRGSEVMFVSESEDVGESKGFVDFEVLTYENGALCVGQDGFAIKQQSSLTQAAFVELLRTGR
jgi:hypothetical protein